MMYNGWLEQRDFAMPQRWLPGFDELIGESWLTRLEKHTGTVYGFQPDYCLAYFNPAWQRFARENGGEPAISRDWGLGVSVMDAAPKELKEFYENYFARSFKSDPLIGQPPHHEYECSSAEIYRKLMMTCHALKEEKGLIVVNSVLVERTHDPQERIPQPPDESTYVGSNGLVCQCVHCRRVLNIIVENRWDWVPQWVTGIPPKTSYTLCETCFGAYYPDKVL